MKSFLIGSLPHTKIEAALELAFSLDIPTLPTLPKLDPKEFMIEHATHEREAFRFVCEKLFFEKMAFSGKEYKWQATGPLTLAKALNIQPDVTWLSAYAKKFAATQRRFHKRAPKSKVLLFLDEPCLGLEEEDLTVLESFLSLLKTKDEMRSVSSYGVHCCSKTSLKTLRGAGFDLISLDPALYGESEFVQIQKALGEKLVYVPCSSAGRPLEYGRFKERFASCACGQGLGSVHEANFVVKELVRVGLTPPGRRD